MGLTGFDLEFFHCKGGFLDVVSFLLEVVFNLGNLSVLLCKSVNVCLDSHGCFFDSDSHSVAMVNKFLETCITETVPQTCLGFNVVVLEG